MEPSPAPSSVAGGGSFWLDWGGEAVPDEAPAPVLAACWPLEEDAVLEDVAGGVGSERVPAAPLPCWVAGRVPVLVSARPALEVLLVEVALGRVLA